MLGWIKFLLVAAPMTAALYMFYDYKSQGETIVRLNQRAAELSKQNEYWEGRYTRIVGLNRDKKSAIAKYERAIAEAGCTSKVEAAFQKIKQEDLIKEVFGDRQ